MTRGEECPVQVTAGAPNTASVVRRPLLAEFLKRFGRSEKQNGTVVRDMELDGAFPLPAPARNDCQSL